MSRDLTERDPPEIAVVDIFSGIGGFSRGFEGVGFRTVAFCDPAIFCRKVLRKLWKEVPIYEEIADLRGLSLPDIERGRQANGHSEARLRPDWIVIENVGHTWRRWVPELRRALYEQGYSSLPLRVRADFLGFPHRRSRVFLVANPDSSLLREFSWWWQGSSRKVAKELAKPWNYTPRRLGANDGISDGVHRRRALGNAVIPQTVEIIARGVLEIESRSD